MKITSKMLSIPPYLSTTWKNILSLHVRSEGRLFTLVVLLQNRAQVEVPGLNKETIDEIFEAHARSTDQEGGLLDSPFSFSIPFKPNGGGLMDSLSTSMQHNPEQSNLPPIPPDVLNKIAMITKAFGAEDLSSLPEPEPDCNCVYCQVNRAIQSKEEETVSDEDLKFRSNWEVKQKGDDLYTVTNTLDPNEHYDVFLGTPLGCTCGSKNCDHIRTVLNS